MVAFDWLVDVLLLSLVVKVEELEEVVDFVDVVVECDL